MTGTLIVNAQIWDAQNRTLRDYEDRIEQLQAELAKAKSVLDAVEDILQDLPKDDETRKIYVGHLHRAMRLRKAFREYKGE